MIRRVRSSKCGHAGRNLRFKSATLFTMQKHSPTHLYLIPLFIYSALGRGRNLNAALSWIVAVGKRLQEFHNQTLFVIGQLKITYRHIQASIIRVWWKAVHVEPLPCARLTGLDLILVAGIIEMHHFFQAYEVSIMHVGFYKCVRR